MTESVLYIAWLHACSQVMVYNYNDIHYIMYVHTFIHTDRSVGSSGQGEVKVHPAPAPVTGEEQATVQRRDGEAERGRQWYIRD